MNLEDNPVFAKYNGKTIRIKKKVFTIVIRNYQPSEWVNKVIVEMRPKYQTQEDDTAFCTPSSSVIGDLEVFDELFKMATRRCIEILEELETADKTDFEEITS